MIKSYTPAQFAQEHYNAAADEFIMMTNVFFRSDKARTDAYKYWAEIQQDMEDLQNKAWNTL